MDSTVFSTDRYVQRIQRRLLPMDATVLCASGSCGPDGTCDGKAAGAACIAGGECASGLCGPNGACASTGTTTGTTPAHCTNGMLDDAETDIDCGGPCEGCGSGAQCLSNTDCAAGACDKLTNLCSKVSSSVAHPSAVHQLHIQNH
jgi:hypothetical protein